MGNILIVFGAIALFVFIGYGIEGLIRARKEGLTFGQFFKSVRTPTIGILVYLGFLWMSVKCSG